MMHLFDNALYAMPAGLTQSVGGRRAVRIIGIARAIPSQGPRKGTSRGTPEFLSHNKNRWPFHFLQRSRAEARAGDSAAARTTLFLAYVRAASRRAFRSLSPGGAGLSGVRAQRLAGPEEIRVHVRSLRRNYESFCGSTRTFALHALHAGLRRPRWFSHGARASGAD